jgi:hypothetical protein
MSGKKNKRPNDDDDIGFRNPQHHSEDATEEEKEEEEDGDEDKDTEDEDADEEDFDDEERGWHTFDMDDPNSTL